MKTISAVLTTFLIILAIAIVLYSIEESKACEVKGGVLVRTAFSMTCIKATIIE